MSMYQAMRRGKYSSVRTTIDGITFHSKKEAMRYCDLKILRDAGEIKELVLQRPFTFVVNDKKICKWIADFCYEEDGKKIAEDVKGFKTPVYRIKAKLFQALYGNEWELRET